MVSKQGIKALVMMYCVPDKNSFGEFECDDGAIFKELESAGLARYYGFSMFLTPDGKKCLDNYLKTPAGKKSLEECIALGS